MALDATDTFLRHYGIAGMRWGKRKSSPSYDKSVKTFGGDRAHKNLNVSPKSVDAMKARNYQTRVKNAGTDALSTKELQNLVTRMNLEQQYSKMNPPKVSAGAQIVGSLMPVVGAALWGQVQARRPQREPVGDIPMSTALARPSKKQLAADILLAVGKQVLAEQGQNIGKAIINGMLK
jgi:hypothetical protein